MCFFPYLVPKPKNKKAKKPTTSKQTTRSEKVQEVRKTADDALNQILLEMPFGQAGRAMHHPHWMYAPLEADEPSYITRAQWASHCETLKGTLDTARENGNKIDDMKVFTSGGIAKARDTALTTQNAIKDTHNSVKNTHTVVKDVHNTLKQTCDAINKNYNEHMDKQDGCVAEITKVRELLEEEAKRREEAHQRQQTRQEACDYAYNYFQWLNRDAELRSARDSGSNNDGRSNNNTPQPQAPREGPDDAERRQRQDQELRRAVWEYLNQVFGEVQQHAEHAEGLRENHNHFYAFPPPHVDPRGGWQQPWAPSPSWEDPWYNDIDEEFARRVPPPGPLHPPFRHNARGRDGRGPRHPPRWM